MNYDIDIYQTSPNNDSRFTLGKKGTKSLFTIGLNPSTADDKKPDQTIKKIMGFAKEKWF